MMQDNEALNHVIDAENRSREAVLAVPRHIVLHMRPMKPVLIYRKEGQTWMIYTFSKSHEICMTQDQKLFKSLPGEVTYRMIYHFSFRKQLYAFQSN